MNRQIPIDLAVLVLMALMVRLLTYNGVFGSDDTVYFARALDVANGHWTSANYNGALRYGFNLPAGLFVLFFGPTPFVANLWPLLCSLTEVVAVYVMAVSAAGRLAGLFSALLLVTAPLHVAVATRIHADPVVSTFITLSFVLLWFGWLHRQRSLLFAAGLAIGGIFWAKELVALTWLAFLPMLWLFRRRWLDALIVVGGVVLMLVLHGLLMTIIAGDPLHLIKTVLGQVQSSFIEGGQGEDAPGYYLRYLFVDIRHVGLIAWIALLGLPFAWRQLRYDQSNRREWLLYVGGWAVGLFLLLSLLPVSLSPVRFVMKQSNYLTLFLGPIAILAGVALSCLRKGLAVSVLTTAACLGLILALLQQADYRAFAANSKALGEWSIQHPGAIVLASTNNSSLGSFWATIHSPGRPHADIVSFRSAYQSAEGLSAEIAERDVFAVLDRQTAKWFAGPRPVTEPLSCWESYQPLLPRDLGLGNQVAGWIAASANRLIPIAPGIGTLERLASPPAAEIFRIVGPDPFCR